MSGQSYQTTNRPGNGNKSPQTRIRKAHKKPARLDTTFSAVLRHESQTHRDSPEQVSVRTEKERRELRDFLNRQARIKHTTRIMKRQQAEYAASHAPLILPNTAMGRAFKDAGLTEAGQFGLLIQQESQL